MTLYLQVIATSGTRVEGIFPVAVIDEYESVIWVRRYAVPGEFELYIPASAEIFSLIKTFIGELIVTREDSDSVMYVEYAKLTESAEDGDHILLKGRTIDCVMEKRVIQYETTVSHRPIGAVIGDLITENMIDPEVKEPYTQDKLRRTLAPFTFDRGQLSGTNIDRTFNGENLLEAVDGLLAESEYGLRGRLRNGSFVLELYNGRNRLAVKFSPDNENLMSSEYECDIRGQCNLVVVYAKGDDDHTQPDGSNKYTVTRQYSPTNVQAYGYARYEKFMTASADNMAAESENLLNYTWEQGYYNTSGEAVSSSTTIRCTKYIVCGKTFTVTAKAGDTNLYFEACYYDENHNFIATGTYTIAPSGYSLTPIANAKYVRVMLTRQNGQDLAPGDVTSAVFTAFRDRNITDYKAAVEEQGAALMISRTDSLTAETIVTGLYKIGTDYDLGDRVSLENSYGVTGTARVEAITEVDDAEGYRIYPTFTDWTVT